jgi:hypothetical protein
MPPRPAGAATPRPNLYEARNTPGTPKAKRASEKAALTRRTRAQPISLAGPSGTSSSAPEQDKTTQN